jgi:vacuolar-type H+-ATPase subunit H
MQDPDETSQAPTGALRRLLELEESILERVARAREESERSVARARAEAGLAHERLGEDLFEAVRELRLRLKSEHGSELAEIQERARTEAEKLESCDEAQVAKLASALVEFLLVSSTGSSTKA